MPRRDDISSILLIGSGPIVIGQACEFDYSGTQACRVLREEGYRVILANSNPATIMTDPDFADATYVEPLTWEILAQIVEREQPDAVLPTLGGQTGLNLAMELFGRGLIGVPGTPEMIGANAEAIATAEDREKFKQAMIEIGLDVPRSGTAHTMDEARNRELTSDRFNVMLFSAFAAAALLLAAVGIYGVMSFVVAQRTHEVGIRIRKTQRGWCETQGERRGIAHARPKTAQHEQHSAQNERACPAPLREPGKPSVTLATRHTPP